MQIEDYFDFLAADDIRIKGTRIGIESVLDLYLQHSRTPKQIARRYRTITLEDVYATLLYYEHNKAEVSAYMEDYWEFVRRSREEFWRNPPPDVMKFRELHAKMKAEKAQRKEPLAATA